MNLLLTVVFVLLWLCAVMAVYMWLFSNTSKSHIFFFLFLQIVMGFISIVETVWERLAFVLLTGAYLENGLLKQEGKKKKKVAH